MIVDLIFPSWVTIELLNVTDPIKDWNNTAPLLVFTISYAIKK